ncbi:MAG TPA: GNAT family N-acetyltransferase [Lacisediminihabitans sp.]|uniref:GNAT family N-acetyltransferase n=1 Tax=Lacisediminihabitans sp. TaxID=2787631 RepID=UPI002ED7AA90
MRTAVIETERLWLDPPVIGDRERVVEYCRDPLFERLMTLPWPYEDRHADFFLNRLVPDGWADGSELTWALRSGEGEPLLGVIGWRAGRGDIGFWLGRPHRGAGLMTEAVNAVDDWLFANRRVEQILWECVAGNLASAAVARKAGFRYTGERPTTLTHRDGTNPLSWHGVLKTGDPHEPRTGWPE